MVIIHTQDEGGFPLVGEVWTRTMAGVDSKVKEAHSKLHSITPEGNQSARDITGFCSVDMDA